MWHDLHCRTPNYQVQSNRQPIAVVLVHDQFQATHFKDSDRRTRADNALQVKSTETGKGNAGVVRHAVNDFRMTGYRDSEERVTSIGENAIGAVSRCHDL